MKKLLIIITLFMSSFFLFCNKEVKADITISDTDIDTYITDDFLVMRDEVINQFTNYDYVIFTRSDNSYIILIFESTDTITLDISSISFKGHDWYTYSSSSFNLVFTNHSVNYNFNKIKILDSSRKLYFISSTSFNIIYKDLVYNVNNTEPFVTYYDIYCDIHENDHSNPHQEEIDKLSNFYTLVIQKLAYLAETIASNYIYLSIIVIFILIFVFLLIFRRFL